MEPFCHQNGKVKFDCRYKDKSQMLLFQVVEDSLTPLLSAEACEQLDLLQINCAVSDDSIISRFPKVFEGLGCLLGLYEIATDPSAAPVKHAPRLYSCVYEVTTQRRARQT